LCSRKDGAVAGTRPGGPGFTLPDDLGGKPLVLNVWASWCAPCRTEMPVFQVAYLKVRDRVGFLGLT
jgi:cytochrome c biogenesis protein CcmG/thiol:disulfide interchange protein DsbE